MLVIVGAGAAYLYEPNILTHFSKQDVAETAVDKRPSSLDKASTALPTEGTQPLKTKLNDASKDAVMVLQPEAKEIVPSGSELEQPAVADTAQAASAVTDATVAEPTATMPATGDSAHAEDVTRRPEPAAATPVEKATRAQAEKTTKGQRLEIVAKEKAWIRVVVDGQHPQDVMMEPGDSKAWSAEKQFVLTFGNAGGVDMTLNGKKVPSPGVSGQVVRNYKLPK